VCLGAHVGCTHLALALRTAQPSALLSVLVSHACCTSGSSALAETADSGEMAFACTHIPSSGLSVYAVQFTACGSTRHMHGSVELRCRFNRILGRTESHGLKSLRSCMEE